MIRLYLETFQADELLPDRATEQMRRRAQIQGVVAVGNQLREHFRLRNLRKSGSFGQPSGYWGDVSNAVAVDSNPTLFAEISIAHPGVAMHRYGGIINAKPGKALAIPLRPENKGKWPSERFPTKGDAFVLRKKSGERAFLATREDDGALRLQYLLTKSVTMRADETVLPSTAEQRETAEAAAAVAVDRFLAREGLNYETR